MVLNTIEGIDDRVLKTLFRFTTFNCGCEFRIASSNIFCFFYGTNNMSGKTGVVARIYSHYLLSLYTHCT